MYIFPIYINIYFASKNKGLEGVIAKKMSLPLMKPDFHIEKKKLSLQDVVGS